LIVAEATAGPPFFANPARGKMGNEEVGYHATTKETSALFTYTPVPYRGNKREKILKTVKPRMKET